MTAASSEKRAVVLVSGGLDSATALAVAADRGREIFGLTFRYGQRHAYELEAARRVIATSEVSEHIEVEIDMRKFGGSALTADIDVPKHESASEIAAEIPPTYVPARNTVFLSFGLAWAEVLDADEIYVGVNAVDYSGYPDCRPEYIAAYEAMANLATKKGVSGGRLSIEAPLIGLTKGEIINLGGRLGVDYSLTSSCYDPAPDGLACGHCDSCLLRRKGFQDAGTSDPIGYVQEEAA